MPPSTTTAWSYDEHLVEMGRLGTVTLALQADGKIVAAGRAGGSGGRFALARYLWVEHPHGVLLVGGGSVSTIAAASLVRVWPRLYDACHTTASVATLAARLA